MKLSTSLVFKLTLCAQKANRTSCKKVSFSVTHWFQQSGGQQYQPLLVKGRGEQKMATSLDLTSCMEKANQSTGEALVAQKKVLDTLKCPCCWKFVGVYFEQCVNSHTVCSVCREQIRHCPVCRGKLVGKPAVLSAIVEQLIQVFNGLSSGDKAVDAYLRQQELTPAKNCLTTSRNDPATPKSDFATLENDLDDASNESPIYNAARAKNSIKVFLHQQALMFRTSSQRQDSS